MTAADRKNSGKPKLHYVDTFPDAIDDVARMWEYGESKYSAYNYMKGAERATESYNCARRHMKKWLRGEDYDAEALEHGFKVHHIAMAAGNLLRLLQELHDFPERDDRPCKVLSAKHEPRVSLEELQTLEHIKAHAELLFSAKTESRTSSPARASGTQSRRRRVK